MQRTARRRSLAIVTALVLLTGVAACGGDDGDGDAGSSAAPENVPGVTEDSIKVGTHQPLTGPASAGYSKIAPATKAYFDWVNAEGGVNGRQIEYIIKDDGYNPANTQTVVRELVLQDEVFAILNGLGTPTHTGVLDFLKTNRVPDLFVASGSRSWNQPDKYPTTFGFNPDYTVEGKILATHVESEFAGQTVCVLGQDDDFGADFLKGVEQIVGADGVAVKQTYTTSNPSVAAQVGAMQAGGCQVVMLATIPPFTALTVGTAAKLGYKPQFVVSNVGGDYTTVSTTLGAAAPLLEGLISQGYMPLDVQKDDPWVQLFSEVNAKYGTGPELDGNQIFGMGVGYMFVQALQRAGDNLTRESIIEAIQQGGFTGPGFSPVRYSEDDHSGYGGLRLVKVTGGVPAFFGDTFVTDDGDGAVETYTEEQPAPPENGIPTE